MLKNATAQVENAHATWRGSAAVSFACHHGIVDYRIPVFAGRQNRRSSKTLNPGSLLVLGIRRHR